MAQELNKKFTTQEAMESRWMLSCMEVAAILDAGFTCESHSVLFDFSLNRRKVGNMSPLQT